MQDSPFPDYSAVKAEHVVPGIRSLLSQLHAEVDELEAVVVPTWEGLVHPLERIVDRLSRAWGTVTHLKAVKDTDELRKVSVCCVLEPLHCWGDIWWGTPGGVRG